MAPRAAPPQSGPPPPLLLPPLTQLTARVPHLLGAVVGRVHPQPQWVDTGQMAGIVPDEAVPWGRGGVGLWWPLGYHSLTGCQSLSITLPAPHHLQRPVGNRQNSHCQLPLPPFLILSDEGAGVLMRRLLKSREVQGPPHSLALHPTRSPHIPDFVGGAPGPRLQSVFHCSIHKHSSSPASGSRNPSVYVIAPGLGTTCFSCLEVPSPSSSGCFLPRLQDSPSLCQTQWITPHRSYPSVSGPGLSCASVKADISLPRPSAVFLHVQLARCWTLIP